MDLMDETPNVLSSGPANTSGGDAPVHRARGYQLEMLEASLQQNIIVAVRDLLAPHSDDPALTQNDHLDGHGKWQNSHVRIRNQNSLRTCICDSDNSAPSAVLRIIAELERCPPDKVILVVFWLLLAPTPSDWRC